MAKVTYTDGGMDFDGDLDFNFDMSPKKMADMSKREVITEAGKGFYEGMKSEALDAQRWRNSLKDHMPKGFSQGWDAYDETHQTVSDLYNHAQKEIKPLLGQLAFSLDSFVPESLSTIKKLTTSLKENLYSAPRGDGKESFESTMQAGIEKMLAETFQANQEIQEEKDTIKEKRQVAEDAVRESIENRRHNSEIKLFNNINNNLSKLSAYTLNTGVAIQKKSLELSMRKYMVLNQIHQQQISQGRMLFEQMSAVIKNTSLPDAVKMNASDRFMNSMKNRITGGVQDRMFKHGSILTSGLDRLKAKGKENIDDFSSALQMVLSMSGAMDMMFGEDSFESAPKTAGGMLGNLVGGWARNKVAKPIANKLRGIDGVEEILNQVRLYAQNPNYALEDFKKTPYWKKIEGTKLEGPVEAIFDTVQESFKPISTGIKLDRGTNYANSLEAGTFTKRLQMVQTDVVPGYLARILRAINQIRSKDPEKVPLLKFNALTGQFQNEKDVEKTITSMMNLEGERSSVGYQTKLYASEIGESIGIKDAADQLVIGRLLMETAKTGNTINQDSILSSDTYKNSNKKTKEVLNKLIKSVSRGRDSDSLLGDIEENRNRVRSSLTNHSAIMQRMIDAGHGDDLVKLGHITRDELGNLSQDSASVDRLNDSSLVQSYKDSSELTLRDRIIRELRDEDYADSKNKKDKSLTDSVKDAARLKFKKKSFEERVKERLKELEKKANPASTLVSDQNALEGNKDEEDSDVGLKDNFAAYNSKFALEGIKKTPITSWNYKTDPNKGHKKIGPMAQDLHKQFGDQVAPTAKKIDLVSMNGITMSAIQGLASKQEEMEAKFKAEHKLNPKTQMQEFLLFSINENIKGLGSTMKKISFGLSFDGLDMPDMKDKAKQITSAAKAKAQPLIRSGNYYIDTVQQFAIQGLTDIYGQAKDGKDFVVQRSKDFWENNKAEIKRKKEVFIGKAYDFYGKTLDFGKDALFNQLPDAANKAWEGLKAAKEKMKSFISGPKDIYLLNGDSPVMLADRMRAGYYVDAETGQVLLSIDSLLKVKGDIYDTSRKTIVLTRSDMVDGVYDSEGNRLKTLKDTGLGLAVTGGKFLLDKARKGLDYLSQKGSEMSDKIQNWWKDPSQFADMLKSAFTGIKDKLFGAKGFSFYDKRQITVLAQIRDLLAVGKRRKIIDHVYNRNLEDQSHVAGKSFLGVLGMQALGDPNVNGVPVSQGPTPTQTGGNGGAANASTPGNSSGSGGQIFSQANIQKGVTGLKNAATKLGSTATGQQAKNTWMNSAAGKLFNKGVGKSKLILAAANSKLKVTYDDATDSLMVHDPAGGLVPLSSPEGKALVGYKDPDPTATPAEPDATPNKTSIFQKLKKANNWLNDRSPGSYYEQVMQGKDPHGTGGPIDWKKLNPKNLLNRKHDPNLPEKGEKVVLEQDGVTIYQNEKGINRIVKTPQKRKGMGTRIDDFLKKKLQERRLSGLIDGSYTEHEMDGMEDGGDFKGPMEMMGNVGRKVKGKAKELSDRVMQSETMTKAKDKTQQGFNASKSFVKESGQQAVDLVGRLSKNPAFQSLMKGMTGFKEAYTGEAKIGNDVKKSGFTDSLLSKLNLQNMISKGTNSLNEKEGSRWGRFKTDMSERAQAAREGISDRWNGARDKIRGRMGGRAGRAWEGIKNAGSFIGSGISAGAGLLKGFMGETVNEQSDNDFGTALDGGGVSNTAIRGMGDGVKGKNDADGDGDRDGGSTEMMRANREKETIRKQEEGKKAQDAAKRAADSSLKYKSSENAIDRMMKGASGLIDFLKENAGSMFSTAMSVIEMIPGLGKLARLGGKGVMAAGRGIAAVGKMGLSKLGNAASLTRGAFQAGGARAVGSMALNAAHKGLAVARIGLLATGTTTGAIGSLAMTAGQGLLALLAAPIVLKAAVIAGVGYGIYKTYKYFTRNNVDEFQKLRLVQYGFKEDHSQQHRIVALENYFLDGRISPQFGANFIQQKLKEEEILEIMDIDPKDAKRKQAFYLWLNSRFKPFFLKHVSAIFEANPKFKLSEASKLEFEELGKYLDKAQYLDGPYNVEESPFDPEEKVINTSQDVPPMVEKLRHSKKKPKDNKKSNVAAVADDPKLTANLDAHKAAQAEEAKRQAAAAALGTAAAQQSAKDAMAKRQAASGKGLIAPLTDAQVGDDVQKPAGPTGKPSSGDGVAPVGLGALPVAQGPLALDQDGMRFLNVKKGVNVNSLQPNVLRYLSAMAAEYGKATGNSIPINDGFRSYEEQAALYQRMPGKAAKPGSSMHEHGLAFDIDSKVANELDRLGLLRKYGFTRPVGGEAWHIEPAGIQLDINRAKSDPQWAQAQIDASPGRGGGGYGSQSGSTMKRRNAAYAAELWNAGTTSTIAPDAKAKDGATVPGRGITIAASDNASKGGMVPSGDGSKQMLNSNPVNQARMNSLVNQSAPNSSENQTEGEAKPTGFTSNSFQPKKGGSIVEQTKEAAAAAAKKANMEPSTLQLFAAVESSMGQKTNSGKSNAQGPFQFLPGTWNEMVKNYGPKYGVTQQDTPNDPYKSGLMTAAYMKENEPKIKKHKTSADIRDFYMAHMLGGGGVQTFLKMRPQDIPATMMPGQARNNPSVFFKDSKNLKEPFTRAQMNEQLSQKFTKLGQAFGVPVNFGSDAPKDAPTDKDGSPQGNTGGADVTAPTPSMAKPSSQVTPSTSVGSSASAEKSQPSEISMFKNNPMEKRKPETLRGNAEQASGITSAMERSATATEQLLDTVNTNVVPVLRGMHEILQRMYEGKTSTDGKSSSPTPAAKPPQGSVSQVSTSSLNRTRAYGNT